MVKVTERVRFLVGSHKADTPCLECDDLALNSTGCCEGLNKTIKKKVDHSEVAMMLLCKSGYWREDKLIYLYKLSGNIL